jgi:inner membrane protein
MNEPESPDPLPPSYVVTPYPARPAAPQAPGPSPAQQLLAHQAAAAAGTSLSGPPSASRKLLQRVGTVAGLVLVLLIPLQLIRAVISERTTHREEAVRRVVANTTATQRFIGPLLVIPWTDVREASVIDAAGGVSRQTKHFTGHVLRAPSKLHIGGQLVPNLLRVGLYDVSVYEWRASIKASFAGALPMPPTGTRTWGTPYLVFGIADVRGLVGSPSLQVDGAKLTVEASTRGLTDKLAGVHAMVPGAVPVGDALPIHEVALDFALKGTSSLSVVPLGDDSRVELASSWPHPKFDGFSPRSEIGDAGFKATWEISSLASNARDFLLGDADSRRQLGEDDSQVDDLAVTKIGQADALQVSLVDPVDVYTETDRASKYGILFVVLTFVGFVAFELIKRLPIHPLQYLLVGLALAVFFLLLLSLSEHLAFWRAYVVSAAACIGLQAVYLSGVLKSWARASGFAAMLTALYGVLYSLLASEDNALLMGSLLLFGVLAAIMWATRKIDWYELGAQLR